MDGDPSQSCRILRPAGALFQADLFLGEWLGAEGFTKQITLWKVRPELCAAPEAVAALRRDLNLAGQLSTALVTNVIDVWYAEEAITVVVEQLGGLHLGEATRRAVLNGLLLPTDVVLSAALEVTRALEAAHDPQSFGGVVVHGDIRPENVLLSSEGAIKLTGFGFASFLPTAAPDGWFCVWDGCCYQPPERYAGAGLDPRADIFSLGLVLFEALTGLRPYGTDEPARLRERLAAGADPIPKDGVELPDDIDRVVRRACQPRPEDRFGSASELAEAIHGLLFARRRTGTSAGAVRQYLGAVLEDHELFDDDEEEPTVTSLEDPEARERLLRQIHEPPAYPPRVEAPEHPLIGRTDVLRTISQGLAGSTRGSGMAVMLVAEPGMGRTRLLTEVAMRLAASDQRRAWLHVEARPAERAVRFAGVLRLLAAPVGLSRDCELVQVGERAERLKTFGLDDGMIETIRGAAGLGEPPDPARATGLLSRALITCISSVAHEQTTIVAWDDLQWTDDGSLICLGELMAELPVMPVMALLTATTDFRPSWPPGVIYPVQLEHLSRDETEDLILELIPDATRVEPRLLEAVREHTGSIPLLVIETIGLLQEGGRLTVNELYLEHTGDLAAPLPRPEDAMGARLSRMDPQVRTVALAAALAGPALREDVLAAATELAPERIAEALDRLIDESRLLRREGQGLGFVHERQRRAVLEAAPAELLEGLREPVARAVLDCTVPTDGLDEIAANLLIDAGDLATAAEILFDTAEAQEEIGDFEGAVQRYGRGLELARAAGVLGESFELQLCLGVGRAAFQALRFEPAERALIEASSLADRCQDWAAGAEAEVLLLRLYARQGRLQDTMERAKDAIPLAESTGEPLLLAQAYGAIGEAYQQWGRYGPDLRYIEAAIAFAREAGDNAQLGRFLQLAVTHAAGVGEADEPRMLLDQARPLANEDQDPGLIGQLLKAETLLSTFSGDFRTAVERSLEGVELAHRHGLHELEVVMLHNAGDGHLRLDRPREALYYFSESLRRSRAARYDRLTEMNEMYVGYIEAAHLNQLEGLERIHHALERARGLGRIWNLYQGHLLLGRALIAQGSDEAIEHLQQALSYAQQSGVKFFIDEASGWLGLVGSQE